MRRYNTSKTVKGGTSYGTFRGANRLRQAVSVGSVAVRLEVLKEAQRLDSIAGQEYGDATLWWVIAAASGIGWALQAPPGTALSIPINLEEVKAALR